MKLYIFLRKTLSILFLFFCFFSVSYGIEDDLKTFDLENFYANGNGYTYEISDLESMSFTGGRNDDEREYYYYKKDIITPYQNVYRYDFKGRIKYEYIVFYGNSNVLLMKQYDKYGNLIHTTIPEIARYSYSLDDLAQLILDKYQINIMSNEDAEKYNVWVDIYNGKYIIRCMFKGERYKIIVDATTGEITKSETYDVVF